MVEQIDPMTGAPGTVAWLYTFANDPEHREVKIERYAPEYVARVGLTETPLYTRQAAEARLLARMREPDAKMVRVIAEAMNNSREAFPPNVWLSDLRQELDDDFEFVPNSMVATVDGVVNFAALATAALSAAADAMEVRDAG